MESLSLLLILLLILTIALAARLYRAQASSHEKAAEEEQLRKSCQAQAADQAKSHRAQIKTLQTHSESEKRANGALRYEKSAVEDRLTALITKSDRYQRDSEYHRRANKALRDQLQTAQESTTNVQNARRIIQQWDSFSDTMKKVGFVANTPTDLGRSIEKLQQLRDSAATSSNQAALDKRELDSEKAAKEAALEEVTSLKRDVRILEIDLEDMQATAEANSELNEQNHEQLGNKAAVELSKQLKKAQEANTQAEGKLRSAKDKVYEKHCEITALRAELEKVTETNGATVSTSLQQELSQTQHELATANETIEYLTNEGRALMVEGQTLEGKYNVLSADFSALLQTAREHEADANGANMHIRGMLALFKKRSKTQLLAHQMRLKGQKGKTVQLTKKVVELEEQLTKLSSDLTNANQKIAEHDQQVTEPLSNLTQQVTALPSDLANAANEIASRDQQIIELSTKLAIADQGVANRNDEVTRLTNELENANREIANRAQQATELSSGLANGHQEITNRDAKINELSIKFTNANQVIANRDKLVTRLTSDLNDANQGITKHDEEVTRLTSELKNANQEIAKRDKANQEWLESWDASNPDFANSNCNSGAYDIANDMANGLYFDPQSSSTGPASSGNDMTNQDTFFDFTTGDTQDGTEFDLDEYPLYYGLNNNAGSNDSTNFGALNAPDGLNNGDASNNTDFDAYVDYNGSSNGVINNLTDSGALNGISGSNINGDLSNSPDLGVLNNHDEFSMNINGNASNIPDLRAPNDMSGSNIDGNFQAQQTGDAAPPSGSG
ncbi:hypothetical protein MBLNU13_g03614t1 [Cladosporium sp. NU13]